MVVTTEKRTTKTAHAGTTPILQPDCGQAPLGFAAGDANLYRYVGNNPTNLTDPSGLQPPLGPPRPLFPTPTTSPIPGVTPAQYGWIKAGMDGKISLEQVRTNVPADALQKAASFYDTKGAQPLNEKGGPARAFNQARADFLKGQGPAPGSNLGEFAKGPKPPGAGGIAAGVAIRVIPPLALAGGMVWLADKAPRPPEAPVIPFGGGKSDKLGGSVTIPKGSIPVLPWTNTKMGTLEKWRTPDGRIVEFERVKR